LRTTLAVLAALLFNQGAVAQLPVATLNAGIHIVRAEIANTFESRARGLMFRESLGPNQGMLFIFPDESIQCMWMKNTLIPLSVAFIDAKGVVINIAEMQPHSEQSHCTARNARYALEMTKGWFAAKGVRAGSVIGGLEPASSPR
jgi:hypothetical protein